MLCYCSAINTVVVDADAFTQQQQGEVGVDICPGGMQTHRRVNSNIDIDIRRGGEGGEEMGGAVVVACSYP